MKVFFVVLVVALFTITESSEADEGSGQEIQVSSEKKDGKVKTGGIHWIDKGHKIFRDHQNDIVVSLHNQRGAKKDQQPAPLAKHHKGKIRWADGAHKIFYDGQGDVVTSLHHQRGIKKSQKPSGDQRGARKSQRPKPIKGHSGKIKWADKSHKIFYDGQGDIVTSLHNQRGVKKSEKPSGVKGHSGKIKWADKSHKIFYDGQGDIVTSLHNQRGIKKSQKSDGVKSHSEPKTEISVAKKSSVPRK